MIGKNYYLVLGLDQSADREVIEAVYRTLIKKYQSDDYEGDKGDAEDRLMAIEKAYQILSDPVKRKKYDDDQRYTSNGFKGLHPLDAMFKIYRMTSSKDQLNKLPYFFLSMLFLFLLAVSLLFLDAYLSR